MLWCAERKIPSWTIAIHLGHNLERAEMFGTMPVGIAGDLYEAPLSVKRVLKQSSGQAIILVRPQEMSLKVERIMTRLCTVRGNRLEWSWAHRRPVVAEETRSGIITVGPTLVYGKDRQARSVAPTPAEQVSRIGRAWAIIDEVWPEGHEVLALLTARIVPLKAKGVVSFSYRHRPGLSFINCFDRDNLDLIDDVIHENSHHHLNLLLRKHVMYHGDHNQQIFYSPWRRNLRPLRGILHAAFTFTMGAMLFERLSTWASGPGGSVRWKRAGLTSRDLQRARFRCLEEIESVRYSIQDLEYADRHLKWLTGSGQRLVKQLAGTIEQVRQNIAPHRKAILTSTFGPALRRHVKELQQARQTYGPVRLSEA
jgi:HEXXH motif-containing protein